VAESLDHPTRPGRTPPYAPQWLQPLRRRGQTATRVYPPRSGPQWPYGGATADALRYVRTSTGTDDRHTLNWVGKQRTHLPLSVRGSADGSAFDRWAGIHAKTTDITWEGNSSWPLCGIRSLSHVGGRRLVCRVRVVDDTGEQSVTLRPVHESDLEALFRQMSDPESVRMAAFTPEDPDDRQRFDAHMTRVLASPEITHLAITSECALVGSVASFVVDGHTEVTYWVDRAVWGRGIASRALALFLDVVRTRPLYARAASDNAGSLRVLEKTGFRVVDTEVSFAPARGAEIEETILRLG
jgi:RimJ/RimL family protein N-acetyltransferase